MGFVLRGRYEGSGGGGWHHGAGRLGGEQHVEVL